MGGCRSHSEFVFLENHPKIALNQYRYFGVVYHMYSVCIYVVSYYDFSVLSMSVMGFQKKVWMGGWVGGCGELYPFFGGFFEFFLTLQSPLEDTLT